MSGSYQARGTLRLSDSADFRRQGARGQLPRLLGFGDSITSLAYSDATAGNFRKVANESAGHMTWLNVLSRRRFAYDPYAGPQNGFPALGDNHGVIGETTTQMLARISFAIARRPDIVVLMAGTNDIGAGATGPEIWARLRTIVERFNEAGARVVMVPITPRGSVNWDAMGTAAVQRKLRASWVNNQMLAYARINPAALVADPRNVLTAPATGLAGGTGTRPMLVDNLHPSPEGAYNIAKAVWRILSAVLPPVEPPFFDALDTFDATDNPTGELLNNPGYGVGTTGGIGGGATGTVPSGWFTSSTALTAGTVVASIENPRTDTGVGQRAVLTLAGAVSATNGAVGMTQKVIVGTNVLPGDRVMATCDIEVGASTDIIGTTLLINETDGSGSTIAYSELDGTSPYRNPAEAWSGVLQTPTVLVRPSGGAGERALSVQVNVEWLASTAATGVVKIGPVHLRKVM